MTEYRIILILIGAAAVLLLAQLFYRLLVDKKIKKNFRLLQERYGFSVDYSKKKGLIHFPLGEGIMRSYPVKLGTAIEAVSKNSAVTRVNVTCFNPAGLMFEISANGSRNSASPGIEPHPTGDSEFDAKLRVNSNSAEKMHELLNFSIKYKLLQITNVDLKGKLVLEKNSLAYSERGSIIERRDLLRIELLLHLLCEIADGLRVSGIA